MFDKFGEGDYSHVLMYESARDEIAHLLIQVCKNHKFDGIVLEVWFQLAGRVQDKHLLRLVEHLGELICYKTFIAFSFVLFFAFFYFFYTFVNGIFLVCFCCNLEILSIIYDHSLI